MKWLFICVALVNCNPALAQSRNCGERGKIILKLAEKYQEHRQGLGLAQGGSVIELFSSQTGSWTMLATLPSGKSCLLAAGEGWQMLGPETAEPKGDPA